MKNNKNSNKMINNNSNNKIHNKIFKINNKKFQCLIINHKK